MSTIESLVAQVVRSAVEGVRSIVEPEGDDSPLARLKGEILVGVKGEIDGVVREIRDVSERLGIAGAVAEEHERTSAKGFDFEDVVDECVAEIAAAHGDAHEHVGGETGATGSKVGDEVVTLNRDDTRGHTGRFVLEVKKRKLGMRKIQDELDEAMRNREAVAALAVFDSQANAPTKVPFHYIDDKAIVVLDGDGTDDAALRLAYMWARWMVRRKLTSDVVESIDHERVRALIEQARLSIERVKTIRGCHSRATKAIEEAKSETHHARRRGPRRARRPRSRAARPGAGWRVDGRDRATQRRCRSILSRGERRAHGEISRCNGGFGAGDAIMMGVSLAMLRSRSSSPLYSAEPLLVIKTPRRNARR